MKFVLTILAVAIGTYWLAKLPAKDEAKRLIEQARASPASAVPPTVSVHEPTLEEDARGIVEAYRNLGLPRQVSPELVAVRAEAIGTQVVLTYEFSMEIEPVSERDRVDLRSEIRQNFRASAACSNKLVRSFLQRGLTYVQRYNYQASTQNILAIQLGAGDC